MIAIKIAGWRRSFRMDFRGILLNADPNLIKGNVNLRPPSEYDFYSAYRSMTKPRFLLSVTNDDNDFQIEQVVIHRFAILPFVLLVRTPSACNQQHHAGTRS